MKNPRIDVWAFYRPLLQQVLQAWHAVDAVVMLDGLMVFGGRLQIFRLSLRHGCRAIPLAWMVVPGKGLVSVETLRPMIIRAAEPLREYVQSVLFLADRGFRAVDWAALCQEVGWHYGIRLANNTIVTLENGTRCAIAQLGVRAGEKKFFQNVLVAQSRPWKANLSVTWTKGERGKKPELLAVMSNLPACRQRLKEYSCCMSIEESFRDEQSGRFDLEHTRLLDPQRLKRLLLAVAVATLWCHELGEQVVQHEELRKELDAGGTKRELSLIRLGLRFLKRCLALAIERLPKLQLRLTNLDIQPLVPRTAPIKCQ